MALLLELSSLASLLALRRLHCIAIAQKFPCLFCFSSYRKFALRLEKVLLAALKSETKVLDRIVASFFFFRSLSRGLCTAISRVIFTDLIHWIGDFGDLKEICLKA